MEICRKSEYEKLSRKLSAEMEFSEIDSCAAIELAGEFGFGSLSND
jgi:hypothetical protein